MMILFLLLPIGVATIAFPRIELSEDLLHTYGITAHIDSPNYFDLALAKFEHSLSLLDQQTLENHKAFLLTATQSVNAFAPATASRHLFLGAKAVGGEEVAQFSIGHLLNVFQRYTKLIATLNSDVYQTFTTVKDGSDESNLKFCESNQILLVAAHQYRTTYDPVNHCSDFLLALKENPKILEDQLESTMHMDFHLRQLVSMVENGVSYSIQEIQYYVEKNPIYNPVYQPILNMYATERMQDYVEILRQLTDNHLTRPFVFGIFQALNIIFPKLEGPH